MLPRFFIQLDRKGCSTTFLEVKLLCMAVFHHSLNLPGWCWARIKQLALIGSSSSLHSEACKALGGSDGVVHSTISLAAICMRAVANETSQSPFLHDHLQHWSFFLKSNTHLPLHSACPLLYLTYLPIFLSTYLPIHPST